jgi:protein phosphatase
LLTQDQTIGTQLRSRGEDPSKVDAHVQEMLIQAVGAQEDIEIVMSAVELEPQDLLLVCCDGLYKLVPPAEIVETLECEMALNEKALQLITRANEAGGPDNITVILAEICEVESTH